MLYKIIENKNKEAVFESRKNAYAYAFQLLRDGKKIVNVTKSSKNTWYWMPDATVVVKFGVAEVHKTDKRTGKTIRYLLYSNGTTKRF